MKSDFDLSVYLVLVQTLLPLPLYQADPLLKTGSLHLQSLYVLSQGPQSGPQVHRLLPAYSQGILPGLPPFQQRHEPRLIPALQSLHAATKPPLQFERSLAALAHVAHGSWSA